MDLSLAATNRRPTSRERRILDMVSQREMEISDVLQAHILELTAAVIKEEAALLKAQKSLLDTRSTLDTVKDEHARVLQSLKDRERLYHPLRGFPPELLAKIFVQCVETYDPSHGSKHAVMVLSQVCQDWRAVTHSNSSLWRYFELDFEKSRNPLAQTKHWIKFSGDVPLHLSLSNPSGGLKLKAISDTINLLVLTAPRWHSLSIITTNCLEAETEFFHKLAVRTPILTTVIIRGKSDDMIADEFLHDAPLLREIRIIDINWRNFTLRFPKLQSLLINWEHVVRPDFLDYISHFQALRNLRLITKWNTEKIPSPSSFAALTSLSLHCYAAEHFNNAETPRAFPMLQNLTFDFLRSTAELQLLFTFLRHLPHPQLLHRLRLEFCCDEGGSGFIRDLALALGRATGLQIIELFTCRFDDRLLALFSNGPGWLCPNLRQLHFTVCSKITGHAIVALINSRGEASRESGIAGKPVAMNSVKAEFCKQVVVPYDRLIAERVQHYLM